MFTFVDGDCGKLGEFLRCDIGPRSVSARGREGDLIGELFEGVPFWMRRGWTCNGQLEALPSNTLRRQKKK